MVERARRYAAAHEGHPDINAQPDILALARATIVELGPVVEVLRAVVRLDDCAASELEDCANTTGASLALLPPELRRQVEERDDD
jgi:hypothetical protein